MWPNMWQGCTHLSVTQLLSVLDVVRPLHCKFTARACLIETDVSMRLAPGHAADQHVAQTTDPVTARTLIYAFKTSS